MAPKASDDFFGLTLGQARLLLLGVLFMDGTGKIDFPRMAKKAGLTLNSVKTMYPKAKKKFRELQAAEAAAGTGEETGNDHAEAEETSPKKKARTTSTTAAKPRGCKRKLDEETAPKDDSDDQPKTKVKVEEPAEPTVTEDENRRLDQEQDDTPSVASQTDSAAQC